MLARIWFRLAETFVPVAIAVTVILAWESDRRDRAQLAAQLATAQQTINQVTSQQKDRDAQLTQTLAQLAAQKQSTLTPEQILQALPQALNLPAPIAFQGNVGAGFRGLSTEGSPSPGVARATSMDLSERSNVPPSETASTSPSSSTKPTPSKGNFSNADFPAPSAPTNNPLPKTPAPPTAANAVIPSADLKPLYDFALDCKACQAKLAAAQSDLADEKTKSAALTKQRDAAVTAAKGGSALHRIARAAKWFLLGAAAGAVAAKAAR